MSEADTAPAQAVDDLLRMMEIDRTATGGSITIEGSDPVVPGRHRFGIAAAAAAAAHAAAAAAIWKLRTAQGQDVRVKMRRAAVPGLRSVYHMRQSGHLHRIPPKAIHAPVDFYETKDGRRIFILRSTNYVEMLLQTLDLLDCAFAPSSMARVIAKWNAFDLEEAIAERGLVGTVSRSRSEWLAHPQGQWLNARPAIEIEKIGDSAPEPFGPSARPLGGVRVLDVTHVLAGPVSTRVLAGYGADVLHISSPNQQDPIRGAIDTGLGKRQAYLDLDRPEDALRLKELAKQADIVADSWRPGALARRGFSLPELAAACPGLIYVSLSCYGSGGPWASRGGYEPCGQVACGLAVDEGSQDAPRLASVGTLNDYLTAYLGAAGALGALIRRAREGGSYHVKVSLTRTSMWLQELGRLPEDQWMDGPMPQPAEEDFLTMASPFGPVTVARPAADLSLTPAYWARPPEPFGASAPVWLS